MVDDRNLKFYFQDIKHEEIKFVSPKILVDFTAVLTITAHVKIIIISVTTKS
jgi:hypothetical protein